MTLTCVPLVGVEVTTAAGDDVVGTVLTNGTGAFTGPAQVTSPVTNVTSDTLNPNNLTSISNGESVMNVY